MRIGIVTSSYPISSADTVTAGVFVSDVAHELADFGHQVHVLTPRKYGQAEPSERIPVYFIPWWGGEKDLASVSLHNPFTLFRYATLVVSGLWHVGQYARQHQLDALLAMWTIPSGLFCWQAWRQHGIPYGVWALGSDIWARDKYPFGDRIVRQVLRDAKFRFADGVQLARDASQLAGADCEFVPSVRQLPVGRPPPPVELPPGLPHLLFIGRYERNKGPDVLVEAMRVLIDRGSRAHLYLFGVGSLESHLRERVSGHEEYIHLGGYAPLETVMAYMSACDRLVIPSRIESIPLIFVDALQMRIPVISTDVGDLGDLVRHMGVGQVVPSENPPALATAMQAALTQPRSEYDHVWAAAQQRFDLKRSVSRCVAAFAAAQGGA